MNCIYFETVLIEFVSKWIVAQNIFSSPVQAIVIVD